jgi:hypothetical protein
LSPRCELNAGRPTTLPTELSGSRLRLHYRVTMYTIKKEDVQKSCGGIVEHASDWCISHMQHALTRINIIARVRLSNYRVTKQIHHMMLTSHDYC